MLGLVAPHDHGEERRLLLPTVRHGHPEHGPGDAALGVANLGVVGEVAGEADACLGHGAVLLGLSGRAVCPALGPGGRWTPRHAERPPRGKRWSQRNRPSIKVAGRGRLGAGLVGGAACGWGSGMPAPSGQIPPPWVWWENEAPATRAARRPAPGKLATGLPTPGWVPPLAGPWPASGEQLGEVWVEHAELVAPGIAQDPEVKAALLLMVIAGRAQRLQALDLGLNIVGLQVQVHPFLGDLLVIGALEQDPNLGVGESEQSVDGAAPLRQLLLGGIEGGRPERDPTVEVVDIDDELEDAAAVVSHEGSDLMRSTTTWWACSSVRAIAPQPVTTGPS